MNIDTRSLLAPNPTMTQSRAALSSHIQLILQDFKGKEILFYPNPGNAGDSLIATATYQAFKNNNIIYEVIDSKIDPYGAIVFIGGGGNFIPAYENVRRILIDLINRAAKIVILPHTIRGNEDLLQKLPKSALVLCRDPLSYAHVIGNTNCDVELVHDIAISLSLDQFYYDCASYGDVPTLFSSIISKRGIEFSSQSNTFYRIDDESRFSLKSPESNFDLSTIFEFGVYPGNAQKSAWCLLESVRRASYIYTDRLHVGISAAILGQGCQLLDNNYGKNGIIYNHTLRRFAASNFTFRKTANESFLSNLRTA